MAKLPWVGNSVSVRLCKHRGDLWTALFLTASLSTRTNMPRKVIFSEWQRDIVLHSLPVLSTCYTHKFDLPGQICHCSITCSWNCILCIYLHNLFGIRRWANCCLFLPFFFFSVFWEWQRGIIQFPNHKYMTFWGFMHCLHWQVCGTVFHTKMG